MLAIVLPGRGNLSATQKEKPPNLGLGGLSLNPAAKGR
jgi:hypothetical protein